MESTGSARRVAVGRAVSNLALADQGQEGDLGDEATPPQADDRELAPGDQLVGEGPGDPEQLADLGDGVDEALFGCWQCAVCGVHGPQRAPWTSTPTSTRTSTDVSTPLRFSKKILAREGQGSHR